MLRTSQTVSGWLASEGASCWCACLAGVAGTEGELLEDIQVVGGGLGSLGSWGASGTSWSLGGRSDISENYYMRPERPVHQTLGMLKTLTANLDVASGDVAS